MTMSRTTDRALLQMLNTRCRLHLLPSSSCVRKSKTRLIITNYKTIGWIICGCSNEGPSVTCFKTCQIIYELALLNLLILFM
jgi:hypothetical protein